MLKRYINYIKDNPKGYWFKRKLFGWGWVPATWQGLVITLIYIGAILLLALTVDENASDKEAILRIIIPLIIFTAIFFRIAYKRGEKPKWQWGFPKK